MQTFELCISQKLNFRNCRLRYLSVHLSVQCAREKFDLNPRNTSCALIHAFYPQNMSGEETHHLTESGSHHSENGRTNPGFDDPLSTGAHGNISDTDSHGRNQPTDWRKYASETMEDYLSRCPGAPGRNEQLSSRTQTTEQLDPSVKVCCNI